MVKELGSCLMIVPMVMGLYINPVHAQNLPPGDNLEKLPDRVDLRSCFDEWGIARREQGSRPTCSVFTVVGALEFAFAKSRGPDSRLSVEFLNWAANQTAGDARDGGFFSSLWDGYAAYGICPEADMPYQPEFDATRRPGQEVLARAKSKLSSNLRCHWIKRWNVNTGLTDAEFLGVKRTLSQGWPVCGGFRWPTREEWKDGILQMCPPEVVFDGHSVLLVGYRDDPDQTGGGVLIFRNANHGGRDGFMPYAYAHAYMNDALWIESGHAEKRPDAAVRKNKPRRVR